MTSHLTWLTVNTCHTTNQETFYSTSTRNLTIHPRIIENIPKSINRRLSEISIDEDSFNKAAPHYHKALDDSEYSHNFAFSVPTAQSPNSGRRNRHRDIIGYNPPFSRNVATNVGRSFLKILDEASPKFHVLNKIFNLQHS